MSLPIENEPVIIDLFPVSRQSAEAAFRALSAKENPQASEEMQREVNEIARRNTPLRIQLSRVMRGQPNDKSDWVSWGATLTYRALREEAKVKKGVLPSLTELFVKGWVMDEATRTIIMGRSLNLKVPQAAVQAYFADIGNFEEWELEFTEVVKSKLGPQALSSIERPVFSGIFYVYSLFKEGCRDPRNYS